MKGLEKRNLLAHIMMPMNIILPNLYKICIYLVKHTKKNSIKLKTN